MTKGITEQATLGGKSYTKIYRNGRIFWRANEPEAQWLEQHINTDNAYGTSTFFRVTDQQTQATLDKILHGEDKSA